MQPMAFAGVFVQDRQDPQRAAPHCCIGNEVLGPDVPAMGRLDGEPGRDAVPHDLALGRRHSQTLGSTQPLYLPLCPPANPPDATTPRSADSRTADKIRTIPATASPIVPERSRVVGRDTSTSTATTSGYGTLRAPSIPQPPRSSAPTPVDAPGLQLFSHTASNTRFFRSASANIFLSSPFSRVSSLSRRASFISNCPNCRFHR
jgi:hypothetical protein